MIDVDPDGNLGISLGFYEKELKKLKPISELKDFIKQKAQQDSFRFYILNSEVK